MTNTPESTEVVDQVVERAATKVAAAATPHNGPHHFLLSRMSFFVILSIVIVMQTIILFVAFQTRNNRFDNKQRIQSLCKVVSMLVPTEKFPGITVEIAECLR